MAARRVGRRTGRLVPQHRVLGPVSAAAVTGSLIAGWLLAGAARRVSVRTGVSGEEALGPLPGDEFIAHPMVEWTRGVTVQAPAGRLTDGRQRDLLLYLSGPRGGEHGYQ